MVHRRRGLHFSDHVVEDRLRQRGITRKDIRAALKNADTSYPGSNRQKRGNLVKEGIVSDGRRLCVVVKERYQHVVVTAWWKDD